MKARTSMRISRSLQFTIVISALISLLSIANSTSAQEVWNEAPAFEIETELLLDVLLDGRSLGITVLAYQRDERLFLALGELMDAIRFPINTDADTGQAGGWFIEEEREFFLNINQGIVMANGRQFSPHGEVISFEGELFAATNALEKWFPLRLNPLIRQLAINVDPLEPIPLQASINRRSSRVLGVGAMSRDAELPFQETPYKLLGRHSTDLRINTSSVLKDGQDTSTSLRGGYSLLSRGDVAWMTSTIALAGTDDDSLTSGRIKLERKLNRPFLNLDHVEVGDVDAGSRGVSIRGGGAERGIQGTFTDEAIDLRGDIPPGWEVELYRNGILVDIQTVGNDAQYEFLGVPLEFGENRFEFVFYGPYGEQRRDERAVYAGDSLEFGAISYTFSAVEDGTAVFSEFNAGQKGTEGSGRFLAGLNVGLGFNTTGRLSVDSFQIEGERLQDVSLGLSSSFSSLQTSVGYNRSVRSLDSASGQIRGVISENTRASVNYTKYLVNGLESEFVPDNRNLWLAGVSLSSKIFDNPFSIDASHSEAELSNATFVNLGTTIPTPWMRVSKAFFYQRLNNRDNLEEQAGGSFNFAVRHNPWRFRMGGAYTISPESELNNIFGRADIRLEQDMSLNFDVRHNILNSFTTYQMGLSWDLDYVQISPQISYDSDQRWVGLVSLSTSFTARPDIYIPQFDSRPQSNLGAAHARVFLDSNGDGVWDDNENGISGVRVDAVQSYRTASTAEDGNAYISRLWEDKITDIAIDPNSLPDLGLTSLSPGVSIRPRPGSWSTINFPIIRAMELEGYVRVADDDGKEPSPAGRILVKLIDEQGDIVSQQRTVFDGFYLFSDIPPGTYDLQLKAEYEDSLIERPGEITVTSAGGVVRNLDFLIAPETRSLARPAGQAPGRVFEGPRAIAPVLPENEIVISKQLPDENLSDGFTNAAAVPEAALPSESTVNGNWHVQFGAFSQEENARRRWEQLQSADILPDTQGPRYQRSGNLVRLLTDVGLAEGDARALCNQVKATGLGDCLVRQLNN